MTIEEKLNKKGFDLIHVYHDENTRIGYQAKMKKRNYKSGVLQTQTELWMNVSGWNKKTNQLI